MANCSSASYVVGRLCKAERVGIPCPDPAAEAPYRPGTGSRAPPRRGTREAYQSLRPEVAQLAIPRGTGGSVRDRGLQGVALERVKYIVLLWISLPVMFSQLLLTPF